MEQGRDKLRRRRATRRRPLVTVVPTRTVSLPHYEVVSRRHNQVLRWDVAEIVVRGRDGNPVDRFEVFRVAHGPWEAWTLDTTLEERMAERRRIAELLNRPDGSHPQTLAAGGRP